jgi:hypothetical protein
MSTLFYQQIGLRPAQWKAVQKKARGAGQSAAEYVRFVIERDLLADKSFAEILRPIRDDVRKTGLEEDELRTIVNEARGGRKGRKVRRRRADPAGCARSLTATR